MEAVVLEGFSTGIGTDLSGGAGAARAAILPGATGLQPVVLPNTGFAGPFTPEQQVASCLV